LPANAAAAAAAAADPRSLWLGAPNGDDSQRSQDEVRIINQLTMEEVEKFLTENAVDMGAANQLRREPTHIALAVIERGPLRSCRDPSGVIVARIRDAKKGTLGPAPTNIRPAAPAAPKPAPALPTAPLDANASELDKFLVANRIDPAGVIALKSESPEVQAAVMAKGTLGNSTNPSASLVARIRLLKEPGQNLPPPMAPGLVPPPPAGAPALATPPPPALMDGDVSSEAMKAIQKLQAAQSQPGTMPATMPGDAPPPPIQNGTSPAIDNAEDKRLQEEALSAMQAINQDEL